MMNPGRTRLSTGLGVVGVLLGLALSIRGEAPDQHLAPGRYQLTSGPYLVLIDGKPITSYGLFRLDTATGEVIEIYSSADSREGIPHQKSRPFFK